MRLDFLIHSGTRVFVPLYTQTFKLTLPIYHNWRRLLWERYAPDQFVPLCACLYTQRSLCQRSIIGERCEGKGVVGGSFFASQERPNWVEGQSVVSKGDYKVEEAKVADPDPVFRGGRG